MFMQYPFMVICYLLIFHDGSASGPYLANTGSLSLLVRGFSYVVGLMHKIIVSPLKWVFKCLTFWA